MKPLPATDKDKDSTLLQSGFHPHGRFKSLKGVCIL